MDCMLILQYLALVEGADILKKLEKEKEIVDEHKIDMLTDKFKKIRYELNKEGIASAKQYEDNADYWRSLSHPESPDVAAHGVHNTSYDSQIIPTSHTCSSCSQKGYFISGFDWWVIQPIWKTSESADYWTSVTTTTQSYASEIETDQHYEEIKPWSHYSLKKSGSIEWVSGHIVVNNFDNELQYSSPFVFTSTYVTPSYATLEYSWIDDVPSHSRHITQASANTTTTVTSDKNYNNVTIEDGGILDVQNVIIKIDGTYTENGTGKIKVGKTGCIGGTPGIGVGGISGVAFRAVIGSRGRERPAKNSDAAINIPAGNAPSCTDFINAATFENDLLLFDVIAPKIRSQIQGGKGSDGTEAAPSGTGGRGGTDSFRFGTWRTNNLGGRGANGVAGVMGGGKFLLYIRNIATTLRIDAKGSDGNNGLQGTAEAGIIPTASSGSAGSAGSAASSSGTLGSDGAQGAIVYVVYNALNDNTQTNTTITNSVDISGGVGGFNGSVAGAANALLTSKGSTGPDGLKIVESQSDLTT